LLLKDIKRLRRKKMAHGKGEEVTPSRGEGVFQYRTLILNKEAGNSTRVSVLKGRIQEEGLPERDKGKYLSKKKKTDYPSRPERDQEGGG